MKQKIKSSIVLRMFTFGLLWLAAAAAQAEEGAPLAPPQDTLPEKLILEKLPRGLSLNLQVPQENELNEKRIALGRKLFFDTRLSADNTVSCATCHRPEHGFASPDAVAVGIRGGKGTRNAPSILNRGFGTSFFWDGRSDSLEAQSLKPIEHPQELGHRVEQVVSSLAADNDYRALFEAAYEGGVSAESLSRALSSFERVLITGDSGFDRFIGGTYTAITEEQRKGMWVFESKGKCWSCHSGANFSDEDFHNTGVAFKQASPDEGRFLVTMQESDRRKFKTPTLRNVAETSPYMHDGSQKTLRDVVEFYNKGGSDDPQKDRRMAPLRMSDEEMNHLVKFLEGLSGTHPGNVHSAAQ